MTSYSVLRPQLKKKKQTKRIWTDCLKVKSNKWVNINNNNDNDNNNNNNEKILLTTMLTIKILFTINSLEKKEKNYSFKTLFTIPVDLKST